MISLTEVVWIVVYFLCVVAVFAALDWLVRTAPFVPDGWKPNLRWVLMALGVLVCIGIIMTMFGGRPVFRA
jgi:hypothetical protein